MLWKLFAVWAVICLSVPGLRAEEESGEQEIEEVSTNAEEYEMSTAESSNKRKAGVEPDEAEEITTGIKDFVGFTSARSRYIEKFMKYTMLHLYNRNRTVQTVMGTDWFKKFDQNKDLVVMVHGVLNTENYVSDFFTKISGALLENGDYNVIGVNWTYFVLEENDEFDSERNTEAVTNIGHLLLRIVKKAINEKKMKNIPKTYYIGHDLGTVPVVVLQTLYSYKFNNVYGVNPRNDLGSHSSLQLSQQHGDVVQALFSSHFSNSIAHRDYVPIYNKDFKYHGNYLELGYTILADSIRYANVTARFCSSHVDYKKGHCSKLVVAPLWYRQAGLSCGQYPVGKYFFEWPKPEISELMKKCRNL